MPNNTHLRAIKISFCLYFVATWISIAGMELFGWLTLILTTAYFIRFRASQSATLTAFKDLYPWKTLAALFAIVVVGLLLQHEHNPDYQWGIGSMRWMFLLASGSLTLALLFPTTKGLRVFLIAVSLTSAYAIFQTFTGIDLLRPGSNRAVQPLMPPVPGFDLYRSAGPWGHSLQYAYIAGQQVCFALAVVLIFLSEKLKRNSIFWLAAVALVICSLSVLTTFARGSWIAVSVAWLVMAYFVSRAMFARFLGALAAFGALAFALVTPFRSRVLTIFDPTNVSNVDRSFLWKINWQMFKDHPLLGLGYLENEPRAKEYAIKLGNPDAFLGHAHSNYLQMLSGTGILGFACYMFLIGYMFVLSVRLWKRLPLAATWPRAITLGAIGAQVVLHVGGITEANFKTGTISHTTMMVWSLVIGMSILARQGVFMTSEAYTLTKKN